MPVLDHLAQHSGSELTAAQAARLDELADLYQTLQLDVLSAWPRGQEYGSWPKSVNVVRALGAFDPARVAAEADMARQRVAQFGTDAFYALDMASQRRQLNRWHDIDDPEAGAGALSEALFMGKMTASVAAAALSAAPRKVAIPLLEAAVPDLASIRDHQRAAALALARLEADEPLTEWANSNHRRGARHA